MDITNRFWKKVDVGHPLGCWLWMAAKQPNGYGRFKYKGKAVLAHRFSLAEIQSVEISSLLCLDHLCRNRACVNPDHLEEVSHKENVMRGFLPKRLNKTHCPQGHAYIASNVYINPSTDGIVCKTCQRARNKVYMREVRGRR